MRHFKINFMLVLFIQILTMKEAGQNFNHKGRQFIRGTGTGKIKNNFQKETRIIGGEPVEITDYPYLVGVALRNLHVCGGSYIRPLWVLTAAHCLKRRNPALNFTCTMGQTYLYEEGKDIQVRQAIKVIPHHNYNYENDSNDIGLMNLESPFALGPKVAMVQLPDKPFLNFKVKCKVAGWGVTSEDDINNRSKLSKRLRGIRVPIVPQARCAEIYYPPRYRPHFTDVKVFCAGYETGGIDACQGDSGGPFVCNDIQIGIISWGIGCGRSIPGVYVNITSYMKWLTKNLNRKSFRSSDGVTLRFINLFAIYIIWYILYVLQWL